MRRKDELELRRAARLLLKARRHAEEFDTEVGAQFYRLRIALGRVVDDAALSESAQTFIKATRDEMNNHRSAHHVADRAFDKTVASLALLLGVR